jgi:putative molybdopterin biosynthesis protein
MLETISDLFLTMSAGGFAFLSAPSGSIGGLEALKRGECHIAPIHLLDENTGEYNIPFIRAHFPDEDMALIKGVRRTVGLIVQKGNPLNIKGVGDLAACRYINRQRGSGARIFLDYQLKQAGLPALPPDTREAAGQLAVAAAVSSDSADAGIGVLSAARALDLDFIPLGTEEFDFVCRPRHLDLPQTKIFLKILISEALTRRLEKSGGYTFCSCGEVVLLKTPLSN